MLIDYAQIVYESMIAAGIISAKGKFRIDRIGGVSAIGGLVETEYFDAIRKGLLLSRQPRRYVRRGNLEKSGFGYVVDKRNTSLSISVYSNAMPNKSLMGKKAGKQMSLYFPGAGLYMYERMHLWVSKHSMWRSIVFEPMRYIQARAVTEKANNNIQKKFNPYSKVPKATSSTRGTVQNRLHAEIQKRLSAVFNDDKAFKELMAEKVFSEVVGQLIK